MDSFSLFDLLMVCFGVYVLYAGITGKGRMYIVENIKEGMEEKLKKLMRKLYIALGIVMIINAGATLVKNTFYAYEEVTPATETAQAVYEWVSKKDLGAFSFLTVKALDVISYVFLGISLVAIVLLFVFIRKMTDKNAPRKAPDPAKGPEGARQAGHVLPVSAFEFEDEAPAEAAGHVLTASDFEFEGKEPEKQDKQA